MCTAVHAHVIQVAMRKHAGTQSTHICVLQHLATVAGDLHMWALHQRHPALQVHCAL